MNKELITKIKAYINRNKIDCFILDESETRTLLEQVCKTFNLNTSNLYLWDNVTNKKIVGYNESKEIWESELLREISDFQDRIFLVITDEEFPPWKILRCDKKVVLDILNNQQYFEFFLFDFKMQKIIFDTHSNEVIIVKV